MSSMIANDGIMNIDDLDSSQICNKEKIVNQLVLHEVLNQMISELKQTPETRLNLNELLPKIIPIEPKQTIKSYILSREPTM